nr:Aminotransferase class-V [uncultured bacterium]
MKKNKTHYFSPGPASLPTEVIHRIHEELLDTFGIGVSILEISHRSPQYDKFNAETLELCRSVFEVPETHSVLLSVCGAQQHFSLLMHHLSREGDTIAYTDTGNWAHMAYEEAKNGGRDVRLVYDGGPNYQTLGNPQEWDIPKHAKYLHLTVNNTVCGTEYKTIPTFGETPLVLDMTSSLGARAIIPWEQTALIYASAQKNFGIAGVSVIIMRNDCLEKSRNLVKENRIGHAFSYPSIFDAESRLNTPPVFSIFCMNRMLHWIKNEGGVTEMEARAQQKSNLVYSVIDNSDGFYKGYARPNDRSQHNFVFMLNSPEQDAHFIQEALKENIREIKGYKSTGGVRASMYNGVTVESAHVFAEFMKSYLKRFG